MDLPQYGSLKVRHDLGLRENPPVPPFTKGGRRGDFQRGVRGGFRLGVGQTEQCWGQPQAPTRRIPGNLGERSRQHRGRRTPGVRRGVRVAEGARLESVCGGNSTPGSNPGLSASLRRNVGRPRRRMPPRPCDLPIEWAPDGSRRDDDRVSRRVALSTPPGPEGSNGTQRAARAASSPGRSCVGPPALAHGCTGRCDARAEAAEPDCRPWTRVSQEGHVLRGHCTPLATEDFR